MDAILVCGVTVTQNDKQTFRTSAEKMTLSETCVSVMGEIAGKKVTNAIDVAVKGMKDDPDGYNIFSSNSSSEHGQGYGMSSIEARDELSGSIKLNAYDWTATNVKSEWFFVKRDSSTVHLQYHSIDAVLNYKAYEEVKDDINTQIKSYRKSKIIAIKPKEEKKVA
ncbi:hypothetical protein KW764_003915 [Vibrio mimicus]